MFNKNLHVLLSEIASTTIDIIISSLIIFNCL